MHMYIYIFLYIQIYTFPFSLANKKRQFKNNIIKGNYPNTNSKTTNLYCHCYLISLIIVFN